MAKLHIVTQEKVDNMDTCLYNNCHTSSFAWILTQRIKIIFDSYMGPCLSLIKYGTTHDNYFKKKMGK